MNTFIVNKYIFIANEYFIVNEYISIGNKCLCSKEIYFYITNILLWTNIFYWQ